MSRKRKGRGKPRIFSKDQVKNGPSVLQRQFKQKKNPNSILHKVKTGQVTSTGLLQPHADTGMSTTNIALAGMGLGYNSFSGAICVDSYMTQVPYNTAADPMPSTTTYGAIQSTGATTISTSYSQVTTALQCGGSVGGSYDGFSGTAEVNYDSSNTTTDFSVYLVVQSNFTGIQTMNQNDTDFTMVFGPPPDASVVFVDSVSGIAAFTGTYGDQYINSITTGAQFSGVYIFNSTSLEQQNQISGSLSASFNSAGSSANASAYAACQTATSTYQISSSYTPTLIGVANPGSVTSPSNGETYGFLDASGAEAWADWLLSQDTGTLPDSAQIVSFTTTPYDGFVTTSTYWPQVKTNRNFAVGPITGTSSSPPTTLWQMFQMADTVSNANSLIIEMYNTYGITTITSPTAFLTQATTDQNTLLTIQQSLVASPATTVSTNGLAYTATAVLSGCPSISNPYMGTVTPNWYGTPEVFNLTSCNNTTGWYQNAPANVSSAASMSIVTYVGASYGELANAGANVVERYNPENQLVPIPVICDAVPNSVLVNQTITNLETFNDDGGNWGYQIYMNVPQLVDESTTSTSTTTTSTNPSYTIQNGGCEGTGQGQQGYGTATTQPVATQVNIFNAWYNAWDTFVIWAINVYTTNTNTEQPVIGTPSATIASYSNAINADNYGGGGFQGSMFTNGYGDIYGSALNATWGNAANNGYVNAYDTGIDQSSLSFQIPPNTSSNAYVWMGFCGNTSNGSDNVTSTNAGALTGGVWQLMPIVIQMPAPVYTVVLTPTTYNSPPQTVA